MNEENALKLYSVTYNTWNMYFSDLIPNNMLAVGLDPEDAVRRVREIVETDARDFKATEISNVMGFKIVTLGEGMSNSSQSPKGAAVRAETPGQIILTLMTKDKSDSLILPAAEEQMEDTKRYLEIDDFSQAVIASAEYVSPFGGQPIPVDCTTVENANELALCLQKIQADGEMGNMYEHGEQTMV